MLTLKILVGVSRAVISASMSHYLFKTSGLLRANDEVGITTNEASDLTAQIRSLKDKVERLMV